MQRTYHGSCHCGAVRFVCDMDLSTGTSRCNCTICLKTRFWKIIVPAASLRLEQGADALADYQFGAKGIHHRFCRTCGVKPFGEVFLPASVVGEGQEGDYRAINVACLDDASEAELAAAPITFENGREDDWSTPPAVTRHL